MNRRQGGLGLIEILVAVLVFAVGLLGLVGAQVSAKRNGLEAQQRSTATALARDLLERMRSNPRQLQAYLLDNAAPADAAPITSPTCARSSAAGAGAHRCTPAELAAHDLGEWLQLLAGAAAVATVDGVERPVAGLLEPRACVAVASGRVSVAIAWRGLQPLTGSAESSCGAGGGWYGPADELRRVLVMRSWIGWSATGAGG
ncbi:type IV pilus modification protein PilV [Haliea sp. E1-2-M8]|uniref:type IV pilus modification protein PilV n=1 Tax=Haliea sp. E1-2-M8 TaxID=3064706 RepID=UPI002720BE6C|nr:type IV pilus modification protein PilV [Haliea sp. E1-2-M8]MDO8862483.1 type IV pilus modification protein PilV [Haliea sp. E1-2-M8]